MSGRPCGCDPEADHVCREHTEARDDSEFAEQGHRFTTGGLSTAHVAITGPLEDGQFAIDTDTDTVYLERFALERFVEEALRRLKVRA